MTQPQRAPAPVEVHPGLVKLLADAMEHILFGDPARQEPIDLQRLRNRRAVQSSRPTPEQEQ